MLICQEDKNCKGISYRTRPPKDYRVKTVDLEGLNGVNSLAF